MTATNPGPATGALILAAGKGTRMKSERPKVLFTLLGEPMLSYVYDALGALGGPVFTVVGHASQELEAAFPQRREGFVLQAEQLGTGHALSTAWPALRAAGISRVLVVNGDTPLLSVDALDALAGTHEAAGADITFLSVKAAEPGAFGRVLRAPGGAVAAIVEAKDFDEAAHGPWGGEINAGIYLLELDAVEPLLALLTNDNAGGEYYITDLMGLAVERGLTVHAHNAGARPELLGVNSPAELVAAEETLRARIVAAHLAAGALVRQPAQAVIGPRAALAPGCEVLGPCEILGATDIARGAVVGPQVWIKDSQVGEGSEIRPFSHLEEARVEAGCQVGPYARLRPGALVQDGARVGNFVEMKKAVLRPGAKANHLTYLGDAEVGEGANIGAGTITCNYDGVNKHKTTIGARAFIGSNTALVAPVTVGEGALVGAGSVITKDVEPGTLALTRAKQKSLPKPRK
ncbi:bifunctional UDP-N-acetylglucosamine diphosphorylase/glucosamine-1-phosphate N-acetyltransferase GlmU [Desulfocurvus sp. DL9XJH121]